MRTQPIAVPARWARRPAGFGFLAFAAALGAALTASAEKLAFLGTTDKDPLQYALNETITFTVTLVDKDNGNAAVTGRDLKWTLSGDDSSLTNGTATSDAPLVVTTAIASPGFVRLKVQVDERQLFAAVHGDARDEQAALEIRHAHRPGEGDRQLDALRVGDAERRERRHAGIHAPDRRDGIRHVDGISVPPGRMDHHVPDGGF